MQNFCLSDAIFERLQSVEEEFGVTDRIVQLDANDIDTWEFRDRKLFELGDIEELAKSIDERGQVQPIVVVKSSGEFKPKDYHDAKYVVIAGYRRWMACKTHGLPVQAVVREFSFGQAIACLVSENEKENVSEYSKGFFYQSLLQAEKLTREQLSHKLGISPSVLSNYLAFVKVPDEVWEAVGDLSLISANTAATIRSIANKGPLHVEALIAIADKIAKGYGEKRIRQLVEGIFSNHSKFPESAPPIKHKLDYKGKVLMKLNNNAIKLNKAFVKNDNFDELIGELEKVLIYFSDKYMQVKDPEKK
jgi:ParB family transcriptional regulator, chromosome partitioning protein